jgi:phage/plasmid-like protein (TIGR03299 family)
MTPQQWRCGVSRLEGNPKMSHNIENRDGVYSFAFTGERDQIWHRLGQELMTGAGRDEWLNAAGFDYHVEKVPAIASLNSDAFNHIAPELRFVETDKKFLVRQDNGHVLGIAGDGYQVVQPVDVWDWFENYITGDERFHIDAAGVLGSGERLWMTARFNGSLDVAGDRHIPRLLMSTSFDASQATRNEATMTRVVCQNTLRIAHSSAKALIKTRHSTRFDGAQVHRELAQIASSFVEFKAMGDAMAATAMTRQDVQSFFATLLGVDANAKPADISTRTKNIAMDLAASYRKTQSERNSSRDDVWTALQSVTRYVDHDRTVRNAVNETVGRFDSGTFGSGDAMKGKALNLLFPLIDKSLFRDKVLIPA